jgi:signal recognition particle subunit SRP54
MLVAADLQRPAAVDQLEILAGQLGLSFYCDRSAADPVAVCRQAVQQARERGADVLLLDTAGRLHIDEELMAQLQRIDRQIGPQHVYLVVDGMTGQDAVQSAKAFNDSLELDGVIMTKLDGDARGGAALSVKHITGVPIKFVGTGEHLDALEEFHADRMAGRILGQGDILSLVEKAQQEFDQEELLRQEERLRKGQYTLDDFRSQLMQMKRLGPMQKVMGMIPGMGRLMEAVEDFDPENDLRRLFGIIDSMTPDERSDPQRVIDPSRRRRIAAGAGVAPHEVNDLVKQFDGMSRIMKDMAGKGMRDRMRMMRDIQRTAAADPLGRFGRQKKGTGKRLTPKEKLKLRKDRERELRKKRRIGKQDLN